MGELKARPLFSAGVVTTAAKFGNRAAQQLNWSLQQSKAVTCAALGRRRRFIVSLTFPSTFDFPR